MAAAKKKNLDTHILDFVFVKVGDAVDDHPWKSPPEVEELM